MRQLPALSPRTIPLLLFILVVLASTGIIGLNLLIDNINQGEVVISSVRTLAYKISAKEWVMLGEESVSEEIKKVINESTAEITLELEKAIALDPNNSDLLSSRIVLVDYLNFAQEEMKLIESGRMEEAFRIDNESVDPTFERLEGLLTSAQFGYSQQAKQVRLATNIGMFMLFLIAGSVIAVLWSRNEGSLSIGLKTNLEKETEIRTARHAEEITKYTETLNRQKTQLTTSAYITRRAAEIHDVTEMINTVTSLTAERFGYYQVGIYILNENKKIAFLQAASSQTGKQIIGQGFRTDTAMIGIIVNQNRSIISSDIDSVQFVADPNFPLTRSRMMLPLSIHGNIIGIFDLHSDQPRAFNQQDAEILQILADFLAISFDNSRLDNETKKLLSQVESLTSGQTEQTWKKFTSRQRPAFLYTPAGVRPIFSTNKTDDDDTKLQVPLLLHGQKIGTLKLSQKGGGPDWTNRDRIIVEKIADQVALALENSRLVDEAQKSAARDQMISNISTRVRETLDIETVVRTAATELRKVFDLKEAEISVGSIQIDSSLPTRKNTGNLRMKN